MQHSATVPEKDPKAPDAYAPVGKAKELQEFVFGRIDSLKEHRKKYLPGIVKSIEDIWLEADQEYQPHELSISKGKRFEANDETGLRSRLVKVGSSDSWQSNLASPDFYVKVNTALSILIDQNPEAVFTPSSKKYEASTDLVYGMWKNSWEISGARQQLKNFVFNMSKYGTGYMRTYPKIVRTKKKVRTEFYENSPERDVYVERDLVKFNDLCRESLNPWQVWISEQARQGDPLSGDDWYFEKDYSWDKFQSEFGDYKNSRFVGKGFKVDDDRNVTIEKHPDTVTVGFYENQTLDIYACVVPSDKIVLYDSPMQNDDGMISLVSAPWTMRDDRIAYGIGLWEIIRNDSVVYDRLMNMTMDQLVLSIYKMFFYKGTDILGENGELVLSPGKGEQVMDPSGVKFLDIPGPGAEAWKGLLFLQDKKDSSSGVTPQLAGKFAGNTLGQDIQSKEAALERMKTPLEFILDALQQEAYITISWQKQLMSTPEVLEFTSPETLVDSLIEFGLTSEEIAAYLKEYDNPSKSSELLFQSPGESTGELLPDGTPAPVPTRKFANVYRETSLNLEKDDSGTLIESENRRFFRFGVDLPTHRIEWRGIVRIRPQSVLAPSKELTRRQKLDLYNLVMPAINMMLATPKMIPMMLPPTEAIIKVYEEDLKSWIDKKAFLALYQESLQPTDTTEPPKISISVKMEMLPKNVQSQILEKYAKLDMKPPLIVPMDAPPSNDPLASVSGMAKQPSMSMPVSSKRASPGEALPDFAPMAERTTLGGGQQINPMSKVQV